jgi:hypothetical protein
MCKTRSGSWEFPVVVGGCLVVSVGIVDVNKEW